MCKAHILRFRCGHGILMSLEQCRIGPCPVIKTTGHGLPQQPYRCYNCQHKAEKESSTINNNNNTTTNSHPFSSRSISRTSTSSFDSIESSDSNSSTSPTNSMTLPMVSHPLPNVAVQPSGCVRISCSRPNPGSISATGGTASGKFFSFSCNSSNHFSTPHYSDLPSFLPHQNHPCPPCQLETLRAQADVETVRCARAEFPHLQHEMLVRDGRVWDPETMQKPSCDVYVAEKRMEERQVWLHVTRKWTQDLKRARVLVAEEDGLGLFG